MVQPAVRQAFSTLGALRQAQDEGRILEAVAQRCTAAHDLLFDLGIAQGILPRVSCALGVAEGDTREIAILSRVGKPTCFVVTDIDESTDPPTAWLSRTIVQQKAQDRLLDSLRPGDVIPARVTHLEPFGAFVDAGCGVPSLIGIENLSVSRICLPSDRLTVGQSILAAVRTVEPENRRISLTHRELLGTWRRTRRCSPSVRPGAALSAPSSRTACSSSLRPTCPASRSRARTCGPAWRYPCTSSLSCRSG